jgi:hypothetical protein
MEFFPMHMPSARPARLSVPRNPLRRLSVELILIVLAKIAFFALIWWFVAAHYPHPNTNPAAIEHLLAPSTSPTPEAKP